VKQQLKKKKCNILGGVCQSSIDAYYIEVTICFITGVLWIIWKYRAIIRLQNLPMSAWQIRSRHKSQLFEDDDEEPLTVMTA